MKKLTIFRTGEYETLSGYVLLKSAYQIYAQAKDLLKETTPAGLIVTSHIPEAVNTAKIIQLLTNQARICENPRLSRYHAGREEAFKADFLGSVKHYYAHLEHIILVSHNMNITTLTGTYIRRGSSLTIEAEKWSSIFDLKTCRISVQEDRLAKADKCVETLVNNLSAEEKAQISALFYVM